MLFPNQFNDIDKLSSFLVPVEQVLVNGCDQGPSNIAMSYDEHGRLLLDFGEFFSPDISIFNAKVEVRYKKESPAWPILITKQSFASDRNRPTIEAQLTREPFGLVDKPKSQRFEAVLLSMPKFISVPITLHDLVGVKYEIIPFKSEEGSACRLQSDLGLEADNPTKPLEIIRDFLTFTKGSHCGIGNLFAYDDGENVAFRLLGFSPNDVAKRQTNWFDLKIQKNLPEIFLQFSQACSDELTKKALRQTINFYRASNASRDVSLEMSIIAAHSALEAIVNFILAYRAGWSKSLLGGRGTKFSDKNRAAAYHFGIHSELLCQSLELADFSKENNKIDVFEIISEIRNGLVHQDTRRPPSGVQLHETWLIAQWLVEVLIFGVIGYRGEMIDRRVYNGWRGTTCQVPLRG